MGDLETRRPRVANTGLDERKAQRALRYGARHRYLGSGTPACPARRRSDLSPNPRSSASLIRENA